MAKLDIWLKLPRLPGQTPWPLEMPRVRRWAPSHPTGFECYPVGQPEVNLARCEAKLGLGRLIGLCISNLHIHCPAHAADHESFAASFLFCQGCRRPLWTVR